MNKNLKTILFICVLIWSFNAFAEEKVINPPNDSEIKQWFESNKDVDRDKNVDVNKDVDIKKVTPIKLPNNETAFIAEVNFWGRGRNGINNALLVRPMLKEAREVDNETCYIGAADGGVLEVLDLDKDGVSEIVTKAIGSGQGTTTITMYLIRFDGWDPVVLHRNQFGDNTGECGEYLPRECYETKVGWKFEDIDSDGTLDLVETIIEDSWLNEKDLKSEKKVNNFLFKKGKLLPYNSSSKETSKEPNKEVTKENIGHKMVITFPWWFNLFMGCCVFLMLLGIVQYLIKDKYVHKLLELPAENKAKILKSYLITIKAYKILFWISPFCLIVVTFLIYKYSSEVFSHITVMLILIYFVVLEDFLYKEFLVKKLKGN